MKQPGILMIGEQFFIKIEDIVAHFPSQMCSIETSVACNIALIYILNLQYPEPLRHVYVFFEHLFNFTRKAFDSTSVKKLLSDIKFARV